MMIIHKTLILHSFSLHSSYKLDTKLLCNIHKNYSTKIHKSYSKELRAIYVNFTVALLHNKLNIDKNKFNNYSSIIKFLENHKGDKLFTRHYVSKLKNTKEFKRIPLTSESLDFINYVKKTFPEFNDSLFVYNSVTSPQSYIPSAPEAKYTEVTTKATEVTAKATKHSATYPKDQQAKTAKHSLRSIYL
jgi:hypothetical protein